jgi:CheY-like chemotaxis protein
MTALRVLHVDDEPDIREVVEFSLGLDPDLVMRSCASGAEVLSVAEIWSPDIVLMDVMMPVMDGAATLARLRENPRTASIPVVFMTARAQSREIDQLRSLGAIGVISKPFDPMKLAASVRAQVEPLERRFGELRVEFLRRVDRDLVALAGHWLAINKSACPSSLDGIKTIAHGLAGAGGIFGFAEISDAAATLEEAAILQGSGSGTMGQVGSALERMVACAQTRDGRPQAADRTYK